VEDSTKQTSESAPEQETSSRKSRLWGAIRGAADKATQVTRQTAREGKRAGKQAAQTAQDAVGKLQRNLGEDLFCP
jgi:hypothetical protein